MSVTDGGLHGSTWSHPCTPAGRRRGHSWQQTHGERGTECRKVQVATCSSCSFRERPMREFAAMGTTDNIPESSFATVNNEPTRDNYVQADPNCFSRVEDTVWRIPTMSVVALIPVRPTVQQGHPVVNFGNEHTSTRTDGKRCG